LPVLFTSVAYLNLPFLGVYSARGMVSITPYGQPTLHQREPKKNVQNMTKVCSPGFKQKAYFDSARLSAHTAPNRTKKECSKYDQSLFSGFLNKKFISIQRRFQPTLHQTEPKYNVQYMTKVCPPGF
jgi:hypothetical protein